MVHNLKLYAAEKSIINYIITIKINGYGIHTCIKYKNVLTLYVRNIYIILNVEPSEMNVRKRNSKLADDTQYKTVFYMFALCCCNGKIFGSFCVRFGILFVVLFLFMAI